MTKLTISRRLGLLIGGSLLGLAVLVATFLMTERSLIMEERQSGVRQAVETAYGLLQHHQEQASRGLISQSEARQRATQAIKSLRYSGDQYFFIQDTGLHMVMHPTSPRLDGTDVSGLKDPDGRMLTLEMNKLATSQGSGFVFYRWPKPGSDVPMPKVSFVKAFAPWNWVIGSGVYIDSVDTVIHRRIAAAVAGASLLAALLGGVGIVIARGMLRQLGGEPDAAAGIAHRIAQGDLSVDVEVRRGDEHSLLHAIKAMQESLRGLVGRVFTGSAGVASASTEIAQGNHDLSSRTGQQAAALEETAASMQELSSAVLQNSDNARRADELARQAAEARHAAEASSPRWSTR